MLAHHTKSRTHRTAHAATQAEYTTLRHKTQQDGRGHNQKTKSTTARQDTEAVDKAHKNGRADTPKEERTQQHAEDTIRRHRTQQEARRDNKRPKDTTSDTMKEQRTQQEARGHSQRTQNTRSKQKVQQETTGHNKTAEDTARGQRMQQEEDIWHNMKTEDTRRRRQEDMKTQDRRTGLEDTTRQQKHAHEHCTDQGNKDSWEEHMLPKRVSCYRLCAMPVQHLRILEQAQRRSSPEKNTCDKQVSSWRHISCHTDKNRYYT